MRETNHTYAGSFTANPAGTHAYRRVTDHPRCLIRRKHLRVKAAGSRQPPWHYTGKNKKSATKTEKKRGKNSLVIEHREIMPPVNCRPLHLIHPPDLINIVMMTDVRINIILSRKRPQSITILKLNAGIILLQVRSVVVRFCLNPANPDHQRCCCGQNHQGQKLDAVSLLPADSAGLTDTDVSTDIPAKLRIFHLFSVRIPVCPKTNRCFHNLPPCSAALPAGRKLFSNNPFRTIVPHIHLKHLPRTTVSNICSLWHHYSSRTFVCQQDFRTFVPEVSSGVSECSVSYIHPKQYRPFFPDQRKYYRTAVCKKRESVIG